MKATQVLTSLIAGISGLLFGAGMIISGMVDPNKVIGFLNVTGNWDPSLAFVMGGALLVFAPLYHLFIKPRKSALNGEQLTTLSKQKIDTHLLLGALFFGIGWGLAGFCPGPVMASLGSASATIWLFLASMIVGMALAIPLRDRKI